MKMAPTLDQLAPPVPRSKTIFASLLSHLPSCSQIELRSIYRYWNEHRNPRFDFHRVSNIIVFYFYFFHLELFQSRPTLQTNELFAVELPTQASPGYLTLSSSLQLVAHTSKKVMF